MESAVPTEPPEWDPDAWVTVHADASYGPQGGGWAVWVRTKAGRVVRSGVCPGYIKHSGHAELSAIFAGIHVAVTCFPKCLGVLVRSDCQEALRHLERRTEKSRDPAVQRLRDKVVEALGTRWLRIKWVKGHGRGEKTDSYVNNTCDRMARKARKSGRGVVPRKLRSAPQEKRT